jgi:hypothetical protein
MRWAARLRCQAIVKPAPTRGGPHVSVHTPHAAIPFPSPRAALCSFSIPFGVAGRGGRGQPAAALGGAPVRPGSSGALEGLVRAAHGVLKVYSRGLPQSVSHGTMRSEECAAVRLQGLELLVSVLLARNRQPPPPVAAGVPHAELGAELISLPSGLLAMVCEAIVKLEVRRGGRWRACMRAFRLRGRWERGRRGPGASKAAFGIRLGARLAARGGRTALGVLLGVDTVQVSDVTVPRARRDFEHTGRLRRSSRLSTLRARASP